MKTDNPKLFKVFKWALYPQVIPGVPAKVTIGGIDLAVSSYSQHQALAFQAALCLRDKQNQLIGATVGGVPPTIASLYNDPKLYPDYPFHADILKALQNAQRPAQDTRVPGGIHRHFAPDLAGRRHQPHRYHERDSESAQQRTAIEGPGPVSRRGPRLATREGSTAMSVNAPVATGTEAAREQAPGHKKQLSEGAKAERRLGWLLCAPAVIVMVGVTGYPIVYAVWLSLERYNLALPQQVKFIGLANYGAVLSSSYWWTALWVTLVITVFSVAITLVLGMLLAMLMHRTIFGRGTVRTAASIPYGIVTVAAAYGWQYAWTPGEGYLSAAFNNSAPLTQQVSAIAVIILAEIWKTTPFMGLLLLAGLSLVPEDLQKAAKVDGATAWQRFTKITVPLMKPAILVALLFRTLDSFRIFDNIYILTAGANNTGSVSILGYDNLFNALNLGIGSAISVLIFICVAIIAIIFIKGFGTAAPGTDSGSR